MLTVATVLGPYAILGPLGARGIAEVYRATGTRLPRDAGRKTREPRERLCLKPLRRCV